MDKKAKNTMIVSVIALALVLIGVTYAYFSARITGLESASTISLTAGRMGIHYSEDDATVSVSNIYPRKDAWITKQITLTGYNTTDQKMTYDLGINIINNTFQRGELTFDLTGIGENGEKIANITGKSIVKQSGFFKFGTGFFLQSDGDTHVYTLKIYFKDNGQDQNYNQGAIFNAKVNVSENLLPETYCNFNGSLTQGAEYVNGQYTYRYKQQFTEADGWENITDDGWGVALTDSINNAGASTDPVTSTVCTYINEKPIVSSQAAFLSSNASSIDLSTWNTSNIVNMKWMFRKNTTPALDLSQFDTSKVTDMSYMFSRSSATSLDLSSFDTSNVTNMDTMFSYSQATSLDLTSFDTSSVTNMGAMFYNANANSINVSSFNTSNVINMESMFSTIQGALATIDISNFDTSNVENAQWMFNSNHANSIILPENMDLRKATGLDGLFRDTIVTSLNTKAIKTRDVEVTAWMFSLMPNITSLDLSNFDISNAVDLNLMFDASSNLETIYVSDLWNTSSATTSTNMFRGCTKLPNFDSSYLDKTRAHYGSGGYLTLKTN